MAVVYRCPQCRQKFKWDVTKSEPTECHAENPCGYSYREAPTDEDGNDIIEMPAFLSPKSKLTDATARQIMDASEQRAYQAAEMAGVPVSEMSDLKITNMNDDKGSAYNVPEVNNVVTQAMAAMPVGAVGNVGAAGLGYSSTVSVPVHAKDVANAGARMQRVVKNNHMEMVGRSVRGRNEHGQVVAANTDVVSDRPSIEFVDPRRGYRPRI